MHDIFSMLGGDEFFEFGLVLLSWDVLSDMAKQLSSRRTAGETAELKESVATVAPHEPHIAKSNQSVVEMTLSAVLSDDSGLVQLPAACQGC